MTPRTESAGVVAAGQRPSDGQSCPASHQPANISLISLFLSLSRHLSIHLYLFDLLLLYLYLICFCDIAEFGGYVLFVLIVDVVVTFLFF